MTHVNKIYLTSYPRVIGEILRICWDLSTVNIRTISLLPLRQRASLYLVERGLQPQSSSLIKDATSKPINYQEHQ